MHNTILHGIWPALVTPFINDTVDYPSLERLLTHILDGGVHGLVVLGSTGEAATQSAQEQLDVFTAVKKQVNDAIPLMAGIGGSNTKVVMENARIFSDLGAQYLLAVTPPYNKPSQEGLYQHFMTVADAAPKPIVVYNVPGRTGVNLLPATMGRLADHENIVALKDASGNISQFCQTHAAMAGSAVHISGDDAMLFPMMACGASGVISVAGNIIPAQMVALYDAFVAGDMEKAKAMHYRLLPFIESLFVEINPTPLKFGLSVLKLIHNEVRLPLVSITSESEAKVIAAMTDLEIIAR